MPPMPNPNFNQNLMDQALAQNPQPPQSQPPKKPTSPLLKIVLIALGVLILLVGGLLIFFTINPPGASTTADAPTAETDNSKKRTINLQYVIDEWIGEQQAGVIIYDLDHGVTVGRTGDTETYNIGALSQLFVALEGYLRVARSQADPDKILIGEASYATCLKNILKDNSVDCTTAVQNSIGLAELAELYRAKGFTKTDFSAKTSTAQDILRLMRFYYAHSGLSDETWKEIESAMSTDQDKKLRAGFPAGFTETTVMNHTSGSSDAALLHFPEAGRNYAVVVLSETVTPESLVVFGRNLENAVLVADGIKNR